MQEVDAVDRDVFISRFNRSLACCIWGLEAVALITQLSMDGGLEVSWSLVPYALVGLVTWVTLWRPRLVIGDQSVEVRNVLRTIIIPWNALIHVDTKYTLTLFTPNRNYGVWVAPAPGRMSTSQAQTPAKSERTATVQPGDLVTSDSGQAGYLVRVRWEKLRESGRIELGDAATTPVVVRIHWWAFSAIAVLACVSTLALTR